MSNKYYSVEFKYELMTKKEAAKNIVDTIIQLYYA